MRDIVAARDVLEASTRKLLPGPSRAVNILKFWRYVPESPAGLSPFFLKTSAM